MDERIMEIKPNKKEIVVTIIMFMLGTFFCVLLLFFKFENIESYLGIIFLMGVCFLMSLNSFNNSKNKVVFEVNGIRLINRKNEKYFVWEKFQYAYFTHNFKGMLYLVLSPKAIDKKALRKCSRKAGNSFNGKMIFDDTIVICLHMIKEEEKLKKIIDENIPFIEEGKYVFGYL